MLKNGGFCGIIKKEMGIWEVFLHHMYCLSAVLVAFTETLIQFFKNFIN